MRPGLLRFEANRNLTGMGHEQFLSAADAVGSRPAAMLARDLLATGKVDGVHIFGNMISVDVAKGRDTAGLAEIVRDLYQYWKPGMEPPAFTEAADEAAAPAAAAGDSSGGGADSDYLRRVPATLVERSRAALAKWKATH